MSDEIKNLNTEELEKVGGGTANIKQAIEIAERAVDIYRNIRNETDNTKAEGKTRGGAIYNTFR